MKPNLPLLHFLIALRCRKSFTRAEVRDLWQGDIAFQSVWSYLLHCQRIEPVVKGIRSRGYRWRIAEGNVNDPTRIA